MKKNPNIIVGMSGGVDSSVTALLLKEQGYPVTGLFMKNWQDDENCPAEQDLADAQAVCQRLKIPLHYANFSQAYWDKVFTDFLDECAAGRTPNPDILCNKEIKFKAFLTHAKELGADFIATGHYAKREVHGDNINLLKGHDKNKDQSYFLYALNQEQLAHSLFPLGDLTKTEVRQIAKEHQLPNHNKKDSTGICFIGKRKFKQFLSEYLLAQPGHIETLEGNIIGKHDGLMYYTIGQRQGLNIGGLKASKEGAWYVLEKDIKRNVLIVGQGQDHPHLYASSLLCDQVHWIAGKAPSLPLSCSAKIRYRQSDQACEVKQSNENTLEVTFTEKQRAITPGQSIVFYRDNECLGGAIITTKQ